MAVYVIDDTTVPTTLNGAINDTTLSITLTDGSSYPTADFIILINAEEIDIQSRTGNVLTVRTGGRGYGDTTAASHADTDDVTHVVTNQDLPFRKTVGAATHEAQNDLIMTGKRLLLPYPQATGEARAFALDSAGRRVVQLQAWNGADSARTEYNIYAPDDSSATYKDGFYWSTSAGERMALNEQLGLRISIDTDLNGKLISGFRGLQSEEVSKPYIDLDSVSTGDNWDDQGAWIGVGENPGPAGSAKMYVTYRGDGNGFVGAGGLNSNVTTGGFPKRSALRFPYNSETIYAHLENDVNSWAEIFPFGSLLNTYYTSDTGTDPTTSMADLLSQTVTLDYSAQPVIVLAFGFLRSSAIDENEWIAARCVIDGTNGGEARQGFGSITGASSDVSGTSSNDSGHFHNSGSYTAAAQVISMSDTRASVNCWQRREFTPAGSSFTVKLQAQISGSPTTSYSNLMVIVWRG